MSVLDIYRQVMLAGVIQPLQANLNFASGFTIVVNPTLNSLDVSVTGGGGGISALTGDVTASGSGSVAATVARINGATVPAAGALTTGNGPYVSGASALTYSALNLAGGAGWVTGLLPAANQAAQTMGGEVTGTTAASVVSGPFSTASLAWGTGIAAATLGTNKSLATFALQFGVAVTALKLDPAGTDTFYDSGSVARASLSLTHGLFTAGGGGSDCAAALGPLVGSETTRAGLYLLPNATAPSSANFAIESDGSTFTYYNTGGAMGALSGGSTFLWYISSSVMYWGGYTAASPLLVSWSTSTTPYIQSGTSATSFTLGTNKSAATLILQYGAAVTGLTLGTNGLTPGVGTQALTAGGSITPSATVLANPYITLTGSLPSNTTVVLPNAVGMWWFDISGVTFSAHTLAFSSGSTTSATISSLVTTTEIVQVFCGGGNTISINV